jgi:tripartite-type tricarboxylate transporter receptor subunit TctC
MNVLRRRFLTGAASAAVISSVPRRIWAQTYPTRPVRLIVGYAAGGGVDLVGRLIGQTLSERLGQQFIVENRPGAGTNIATEAVVMATADGYTLLLVTSANAINATLYAKLNFNFIRDIAPVAGVMRQPQVMLVNPAIPAQSIAEFIAYAKDNPGKINVASAGRGTPSHLAGELFKVMTRLELIEVPYRGVAPAMTDLLGGQVQVIFTSIGSSLEFIKSNRLRPLAVTSPARSEVLPGIPTVAEAVPGYESSQWYGIGAPSHTPAEIIERLNRATNAALAEGRMRLRFAELGGAPIGGSPAEFGTLITDETERLGRLIRAAHIKV